MNWRSKCSFNNQGTRVLFILLLLAGCAQKAETKKFPEAPSDFAPLSVDTNLSRSSFDGKTAREKIILPSGGAYLRSTDEVLEFAETLLDLAIVETDPAKAKKFEMLADQIMTALAGVQNGTTRFETNTTPFIELALGVAFEGPEGIKASVEKTLTSNQLSLQRALDSLPLELKPQAVPDVFKTAYDLELYVRDIPTQLRKFNVDEKIVREIKKRLDEQYGPILVRAQATLAGVSEAKLPEENIEILKKALHDFGILPRAIVDPLLADLGPIRQLATSISKPENVDEMFNLFFDFWVNPVIKREKIKEASPELYDYFSSLTPEEMEALRKDRASWFSSPLLKGKFFLVKRELSKYGLERVRSDLRRSANQALITEFDNRIRKSAGLLQKTVVDAIIGTIDKEFLRIRNNMKDEVRKEARNLVGGLVFSEEKSDLAAVDSYLMLTANKQNQLSVVRDMMGYQSVEALTGGLPRGSIVTGGKTMGLLVSVQGKRLLFWEGQADKDKTRPAYWREVFRPLNQLMAIGGFRYMEPEKPRFVGFMRKIIGAGANYDVDIGHYGDESGVFTTPDRIVVLKDFTVSAPLTRALGHVASVGASAELARGASVMMTYLQDWKQNGFNVGMSSQSYKGINVFPKDLFYSLSLGIASLPFQNLSREGLIGFGVSGRQYDSKLMSPPSDDSTMECQTSKGIVDPRFPNEKPDSVIAAALAPLSPSGHGDLINSQDVARFILAADQFLAATDGVEQTTAKPLQAEKNGLKLTLKGVLCGRRSVQSLMLGMANFLTSRMQFADGGFARYYSIKEGRVLPDVQRSSEGRSFENRHLEDQLLIIQALNVVFERWKGQAYKHLAVHTYFYLNRKLFDPRLGFYKKNEKAPASEKVDVRLLAMAVETLRKLKGLVSAEAEPQRAALSNAWAEWLLGFSDVVVEGESQ